MESFSCGTGRIVSLSFFPPPLLMLQTTNTMAVLIVRLTGSGSSFFSSSTFSLWTINYRDEEFVEINLADSSPLNYFRVLIIKDGWFIWTGRQADGQTDSSMNPGLFRELLLTTPTRPLTVKQLPNAVPFTRSVLACYSPVLCFRPPPQLIPNSI